MKKANIFIAVIFFAIISACNPEENKLTESNLDTDTPELNVTDSWLREYFTIPYNIEVNYKWHEGRVDLDRYLSPPTLEKVIPVMDIVKQVWIDTYSELGGENFIKEIAPRELLLVGGKNLNPSGTRTLGFAEGGKNIVLFETDLINVKDKSEVTMFVKTIQHEYAHILNQQIRYDEEAFKEITPSGYTSQWYNPADEEERFDIANSQGFITDYARLNENEDFAEMLETILTNNAEEYQELLDNIKAKIISNAVDAALENLPTTATQDEIDAATQGATVTATPEAENAIALIKAKEAIVADYFKKSFNIDLYELQKLATDNILKAIQ
ncbi:substrate import-associated zinc metallohydrolase lipoprotein [uncultured Polaribacter sp.]|uniref:substrate import-associated zinc metallohydrolase lipoprotein n=1 Tax=uncultured Polaribacter sp. TaxID=174711 RepID=UPI00260A23AE|nr:substrate import-associated zinc metallohydrolase lipoprotein [uncultured Polaribacter sp.]